MKDFSKNIKQITMVCIFCFVGLIAYMSYFSVFKSRSIEERESNPRHAIEANKILRGKIYDRNKNIIAESKRDEDGWQTRVYPVDNLYGAVIGYSNRQYETAGLENTMNKELTDYKGKSTLGGLNELFEDEPKERLGYSVVTTLDNNLQSIAIEAMNDAYSNGVQGFNGSVVAMNPKTGEILAMVTKPTYNPNEIDKALKEQIPQLNKATSQLYPPGSVFKTITLTAAVEDNPNIVNRTFNDVGKIQFADGTSLNNYANEAHGRINLKMGYRKSSNFVFGTLGMELPNYYLRETAEGFGFNEPVEGIGIKAIASKFPDLDDEWAKGDKAQTGIGQGLVATTPLQMAMMVAAVANDGVLMTPKIVDSVIDSEGNVIRKYQDKIYQKNVMSEETNAVVKDYMRTLVKDVEYSPAYPGFSNFRGLNAGGKTGTADWVANPETNELGEPHGWFVSIAPIEDPKIVVAVVCEEGHSGAQSAAYVAATVTKYYLENN